ncbi:MAG: hypothetical protein GY827_12635 [Cytophagales bacterium]|nr:hypothetical protein [Cytophagales bacterium]
MKKYLFYFFILIFSFVSVGQYNIPFPEMECETLDGKHITLPEFSKGKYTIIGIAYTKRSEEKLKSWYMPIYYKFIYHAHHPVLYQNNYHINVFFMPMFTGTHEVSLHAAKHYFKTHIDLKLQDHLLVYRGDLEKYHQMLDFEHVDKPYILVLDQTGRIVFEMTGEYSLYKMEMLEKYIKE